ncbi:hypothetical protein E2C01_091825 [Portunus trituberculatus]|uniref:Uncharacterized protein n=1 Tax=Portunus trituberculatus TaxID=210409 RepID=A0A5B7JEZ4_PORTR|nr:hypothetical protein [Portunus trituberculatus]
MTTASLHSRTAPFPGSNKGLLPLLRRRLRRPPVPELPPPISLASHGPRSLPRPPREPVHAQKTSRERPRPLHSTQKAFRREYASV